MFYPTALQYVVPAIHGRDQSPGVPRGADGDGAVLYRAGVCSGVLGRVLYTRRYVVSVSPCGFPPDCTFMIT